MSAKHSLDMGANFPYDASDAWWNSDDTRMPPPAKDWAHRAARGVMADLKDRRGIKHELEAVDEATRKELIEALAAIIREAYRE